MEMVPFGKQVMYLVTNKAGPKNNMQPIFENGIWA